MSSTSIGFGNLSINGANMNTASLMEQLNRNGSRSLRDHWHPDPSPAIQVKTHNRTLVETADPVTTHIILHNSLGYWEHYPNKVMEDLIVHQAHVGHALIRKFPDYDQQVTSWTTSDAFGNFYGAVDEGTEGRDANANYTTTLNADLILGFFATLPTTVVSIKEVRVNLWCSMQELGTGWPAWRLRPYYNAVQGSPGSGTIIPPTLGKYAATQINISSPVSKLYHFVQMVWPCNLTRTQCVNMELALRPIRPTSGGSPNTTWYVYTVDIDLWCEVNDVSLVDQAAFGALDTHYATGFSVPYYLTGDFTDGTIDQAVLHTKAHAPDTIYYLNNAGELTLVEWPDFSAVGSPYEISPRVGNWTGLERQYKADERVVTNQSLKVWTRADNHQTPGAEDPTNTLGAIPIPDAGKPWLRRPLERPRDVTRELITDIYVAAEYAALQDRLFGEAIPALEVAMDHRILAVDVADVVAVDQSQLAMSMKKHLVARMEIDLDAMNGMVTLYDRSNE